MVICVGQCHNGTSTKVFINISIGVYNNVGRSGRHRMKSVMMMCGASVVMLATICEKEHGGVEDAPLDLFPRGTTLTSATLVIAPRIGGAFDWLLSIFPPSPCVGRDIILTDPRLSGRPRRCKDPNHSLVLFLCFSFGAPCAELHGWDGCATT